MTPFEFVFALVSVVTSLALTHLIGGLVALIRLPGRIRISLVHGLWIWIAFSLTLANWAGLWFSRAVTDWQPVRIGSLLAAMIVLYAFAALVIPDREEEDLPTFHERHGRKYMAAQLLFAALSILTGFIVHGWTIDSMGQRIPALLACGLGVAALVWRARPVQLTVATVLAVMATMYVIAFLRVTA